MITFIVPYGEIFRRYYVFISISDYLGAMFGMYIIGVGFRVVRSDKSGNAKAFTSWSEQRAVTPRFLCVIGSIFI